MITTATSSVAPFAGAKPTALARGSRANLLGLWQVAMRSQSARTASLPSLRRALRFSPSVVGRDALGRPAVN